MEPSLMVVGLNYRTAPMGVRERFWISQNRRYETLVQLSRAEGIEEIVVLATCSRTEFLLWANDITLAANSVMRWLNSECGLKLCEWKYFYRLLDEAALLHIFQVASSLDSMVIGEPQIVAQVKDAWSQAQKVGAAGRQLDAVLEQALAVSARVRGETELGSSAVSIPEASAELAHQILGSLENKNVLVVGTGKMGELSARALSRRGASSLRFVNRTFEHATELASQLNGTAIAFTERWRQMAEADLIITSTSCPGTILNRKQAELLIQGRPHRPLVIVDIAMPRDVDPGVRSVKGILLYDLDNLENVVNHGATERGAAAVKAQTIVKVEAQGFHRKLTAERSLPTSVALRQRLDEICRQELDSFRQESGPFSRDQDEMLNAVMSRINQRIAGSLARELKEVPEKAEQEQMTTAVRRLFHLSTPETALAGTRH